MKRIISILSMIFLIVFVFSCGNNPNEPTDKIPSSPTSLVVNITTGSSLILNWTDNSDNEEGFDVERRIENGEWEDIGSVGSNLMAFSDSNLTTGTTYYYRVNAYNGFGDSEYSNTAIANMTAPSPPTGLMANAASANSILLGWADNSDNESGFIIYRRDAGPWIVAHITTADDTCYADNYLNERTEYSYYIVATNGLGNSTPSDTATATTLASIQLVGSLADTLGNVFVQGNYAYYLSLCNFSPDKLKIINVSIPSTPSLVGEYTIPDCGQDIYVNGNYAYIAASDSGLVIIDITNPSNPSLAGSYLTAGSANDVFVSSNYAYISGGDSLLIIDISDPSIPIQVGSYGKDYISDIYVSGNYAYVTSSFLDDYEIIDVTNPSTPSSVGYYSDGHRDIFVYGNYAFLVGSIPGLEIIDISDPSSPILTGFYELYFDCHIFVTGDYAYLGDIAFGVKIINISNPYNPTLAAAFPGYNTHSVFVSGEYIYAVRAYRGLDILYFEQ